MADHDINPGILELYKHAQTQLYTPAASWSTAKDFILTDYVVATGGIEPPTHEFSVRCSTN